MNNEKAALRASILKEQKLLPDDYIARSDEGILKSLLKLPEFISAERIFVYYSVEREPDTRRFIDSALALGKTVALPLCHGGGVMDARVVTDLSQLRPGTLGIPAPPPDAEIIPPEELSLIIVPAVAFSRDGYRLGYGGGYYDRYLSRSPAFKAGLARGRMLLDCVPRETHDVRVDTIITEDA